MPATPPVSNLVTEVLQYLKAIHYNLVFPDFVVDFIRSMVYPKQLVTACTELIFYPYFNHI